MNIYAMNKNICVLLIAAAMAGAVLPAGATKILSWKNLQERLNVGGDITLSHDLSAGGGDGPLTVATTVTLDLAGHTLDADGLFRVFDIHAGGHLTLTNSVPGSGAITGGFADYGGGVYVGEDGKLTMTGGTISGNTAECCGGGVNVARATEEETPGGAFEMTGGIITGNFAESGGGVFIEDHYEEEIFEYEDDYEWSYTISHEGGYFSMSGGSVTGNGVSDDGGGVFAMDVDSLFVSGAPVISGNTNTLNEANNVYLNAWGGIAVGTLSEGASIGVTSYMPPGPGSPTVFTYSVASGGDSVYFFSDDPDFSVGLAYGQLCLIDPSDGFQDPQGSYIVDDAVVEWLSDNDFTQDDIDALGSDSAATEKLYDCYMLNCDFRVQGAGATINLTDITVSNGVVSITVQLTRKAPLGGINGYLYFYGADNLADGFDASPITETSVDFGADDEFFATDPTTGSVTQTATATFSYISYKFFKAAIHAYLPDNGGEPWEPED